jgi:hypothetical protein
MTALVGTREQPVLAAQCDSAQRAFGGIVVDLEAAVVGIAGQRRPGIIASDTIRALSSLLNRRRGTNHLDNSHRHDAAPLPATVSHLWLAHHLVHKAEKIGRLPCLGYGYHSFHLYAPCMMHCPTLRRRSLIFFLK